MSDIYYKNLINELNIEILKLYTLSQILQKQINKLEIKDISINSISDNIIDTINRIGNININIPIYTNNK